MKRIHEVVSLDKWGLDALHEVTAVVDAYVRKAAAEALALALEAADTHAWFPVTYSADPADPDQLPSDGIEDRNVADPLAVNVTIALHGGDNIQGPIYRTSLREMLKDDFEFPDAAFDHRYGLGQLSAALRAFADEIDGVIARAHE